MQIHAFINEHGLAEWSMIELQGSLESDVDLAGQLIGNLTWDSVTEAPMLIIGRHLLQGKVSQMEKPFLVLTKEEGNADDENGGNHCRMLIKAVIRRKMVFKLRPKPIVTIPSIKQ